ncbi:MAG TPA: thioredoxin domain-containing protein [Vicinamibacterales bacterium]|jgi:hypothetical protein
MNRLASEKSPYLLQHADNPVHWYSWGDEAFEAARREDRPIFLSVGYSTCHWCHVMAHESFESDRVAEVLNGRFVAIKVDREERPDVDRMYMAFVQATTGGGGWPMSVWLTPDLQPFYGGTYFPPTSRWGRPGFIDILLELDRLWHDDRDRVLQAAAGNVAHLLQAATIRGEDHVPGVETLADAAQELLDSYDHRFGGFGSPPKFPRPAESLFLLREFKRTRNRAALDAVTHTLTAMAAGGMRDQVGGGFHRYSVDGQWRVPHFEKMLYDQAQLVLVYLEAAQASGDRTFLHVAEDTLRYVQRDLTDSAGGFYSAEDADSVPPDQAAGHKAEGAFYLWSADEIDQRLGRDAPLFRAAYGVGSDGNALNDPQGEFTGRNILYQARPVEALAAEFNRSVVEVREAIERFRRTLLAVRSARPRPQLDDKVLTAWNGLMIAAFARGARVTEAFASKRVEHAGQMETAEPGSPWTTYLLSAQRAASFIRERMWEPSTGRLLRRYRDGEAAIDAYAEDYACLVLGLLELFQADGDPAWLDWAVRLQRRQDEGFGDAEFGGWFGTTGRDASVHIRQKEAYDGAEPSASSVSVQNLTVLSHLAPDALDAAGAIDRTFRLFASRLRFASRSVPMMLAALSAWHAGVSEVVVVGRQSDAATRGLLAVVNRAFLPFAVVAPVGESGRDELARVAPALAGHAMRNGRPTAYVCQNFACQTPTTEPEELARQLG